MDYIIYIYIYLNRMARMARTILSLNNINNLRSRHFSKRVLESLGILKTTYNRSGVYFRENPYDLKSKISHFFKPPHGLPFFFYLKKNHFFSLFFLFFF